MSIDRKMLREELYFLGFIVFAIGMTALVVWSAHG